jgi:hypothetical protein
MLFGHCALLLCMVLSPAVDAFKALALAGMCFTHMMCGRQPEKDILIMMACGLMNAAAGDSCLMNGDGSWPDE